MIKVEHEEIKKIIKKNYLNIQGVFFEVQSSFLSGIYNRYNKDLDGGNIVIYFAKEFHHKVLRQKDVDLNHDISFLIKLLNFFLSEYCLIFYFLIIPISRCFLTCPILEPEQ